MRSAKELGQNKKTYLEGKGEEGVKKSLVLVRRNNGKVLKFCVFVGTRDVNFQENPNGDDAFVSEY